MIRDSVEHISAESVDVAAVFVQGNPSGDPTEWRSYIRTIILPAGSAPGTWGMFEMTIYDRAGNFNSYDFIELVHFSVDD